MQRRRRLLCGSHNSLGMIIEKEDHLEGLIVVMMKGKVVGYL